MRPSACLTMDDHARCMSTMPCQSLDAGPAKLRDEAKRYSDSRAILVVDAHFVLECIDLRSNSRWSLRAGRETWLLAVSGNTQIGRLDISIADAVYAEAEQVPILVGTDGLKALVAYPGPTFDPGRLTEPSVAGADSVGHPFDVSPRQASTTTPVIKLTPEPPQ